MTTMTMESLDTRLWVLMSDTLGVEPEKIKMTDSFADDLGVDSLDIFEMLTEVEKEFGVKIADEEAEKLTTVKSLVDYLHSHLY